MKLAALLLISNIAFAQITYNKNPSLIAIENEIELLEISEKVLETEVRNCLGELTTLNLEYKNLKKKYETTSISDAELKHCYTGCTKILKKSFNTKYKKKEARKAPYGNKGKMSIGNVIAWEKGSCDIAYEKYKATKNKAQYEKELHVIKSCSVTSQRMTNEKVEEQLEKKEGQCEKSRAAYSININDQIKLSKEIKVISNEDRYEGKNIQVSDSKDTNTIEHKEVNKD